MPFLFIFLIPSFASAAPILTIKDVSDSPDPFSPNGDGIEDETTISATISISGFKVRRPLRLIWKLTITDSQGKLVKKFSHRTKVNNDSEIKISKMWDGRSRRKKIVTNGKYTYRIDAKTLGVKAEPKFGDVTVIGVPTPPVPSVTIKNILDSPDPFSPDSDGFEDTTTIIATIDVSGFSRSNLRLIWKITVRNSQGRLIKRFVHRKKIKDSSEVMISQIWDGKSRRRRVVPDGKYTYRIDARVRRVRAKPGFGDVSVETTPVLSVSVSPDFWNMGAIEINSATTNSADKITVINDGASNATYSLSLVNPQGWTASQSEAGPEIYILNAAFSEGIEDVNWSEANHALSTVPVRSTSTKFAGNQTGVNVAPSEEGTLWLQFKAPTATSITTEQDIEVIISAELP